MKTEEQVNARIRHLFSIDDRSCYGFDRENVMQEIAVLHWVIDDKAIHKQPTTETKRKRF